MITKTIRLRDYRVIEGSGTTKIELTTSLCKDAGVKTEYELEQLPSMGSVMIVDDRDIETFLNSSYPPPHKILY